LNEALSDKTSECLRGTVSTAPDRPFFLYFATGASHAPHQVRPKRIAKYEGRFDQGWDRLREETFTRQKTLGVGPRDAVLSPRDPSMGAWDALSPEMKTLAGRQMEVFAAYREETDHEIGRVLAEVDALGLRQNTMVISISGDSGASMERTETGTFREMVELNGVPLTADEQLKAIAAHGGDRVWGSGKIEPQYAAGWAWAGNTPFQWGKQVASHLGGTRDPMVDRCPERVTDKGAVRSVPSVVPDLV
jgi:arylsulfatase A-like enzyme